MDSTFQGSYGGGDGGNQEGSGSELVVQADGKVVVAGASQSGVNLDYWIGRFTP